MFSNPAQKPSTTVEDEAMKIKDRQDTRPAWDKIAPGYDRNVTAHAHLVGQ